ncbi:hypothetical protein ACKI1Q_43820, partial [Streptomyces galilaeus]
MSKLEAGAVQAAIRPCDTRAIIEHVAIAAESIARGHNVRLQVAEPLSPVLADPVLLERALLNLLDNAAKYSSQGSDIEFSVNEDGATVTI